VIVKFVSKCCAVVGINVVELCAFDWNGNFATCSKYSLPLSIEP